MWLPCWTNWNPKRNQSRGTGAPRKEPKALPPAKGSRANEPKGNKNDPRRNKNPGPNPLPPRLPVRIRPEWIPNGEPSVSIVEVIDLSKEYALGDHTVEVLRGVEVSIEEGEYVSVMGPSGSGKSTFLNILGCLDQPTRGKYFLGGTDVSTLDDNDLSDIRRERIGFIFQSFNLLPELTVTENIQVPLFYQGTPEEEALERAVELAGIVGLGHRTGHRATELSGGERQRVAIARAMVNNPLVILADEPTGNLDSKSGQDILKLLDRLHEEKKTIIMVTHDEEIGRRTQRTIRFRDGQVISGASAAARIS